MHTAMEKSNLMENGSVKISKRKSKNHRKHQQSVQNVGGCRESSGAATSTTNGLGSSDSLKAFSEKLDECLHIRENGCSENDKAAVTNKDNTENTVKSGQLSRNGNETTKRNCIENGDVEHKPVANGSDGCNSKTSPSRSRSWESNGHASDPTEVDSANESHHVNGMHSAVTSQSPSSSSSSSSSTTEQISNKKECQGLELGKSVVPSALPAEVSNSSAQVDSVDPNAVIEYKEYESELQMQDIMRLIQTELSEPYSIYTYRYFIYNWPKLCFLAAHGDEYVGAIVCKLDMHMNVKRGYIAMLAVKKEYRKMKIGTNLVQKAIEAMLADDADEVVLETEMKNLPALRLYENLGFVRDKRLFRYYLNGVDALRLKLWFR